DRLWFLASQLEVRKARHEPSFLRRLTFISTAATIAGMPVRSRPSIRHDIQHTPQCSRRPHHRHSRLRPYLPHDPKSLTPGSTQERNANIRHASKVKSEQSI